MKAKEFFGKEGRKWLAWTFGTLAGVGFTVIIGLVAYLILFGVWEADNNNEADFYKSYSASNHTDATFDNKYITHRLIKMDLNYGVASKENMHKALENVNHYFRDVELSCPWSNTDEGTAEYVSCANKKLNKNFYYTPSVEVSNNYAIHRSDCDTNTYLMMDALKMKGIQSYIVYVPGHAFLAWKDSFGHFIYQETTWNNNSGKPADLSSSFYKKAIDDSYYTPISDKFAETIYNALIYDVAEERVNINKLYNENKSNSFIADWYFYAKDKRNEITKEDANFMLSSLHTDFTSTDKKIAIIHYLMRNDKKDKALLLFNRIPADKCGYDCVIAGAELRKAAYMVFQKPFSVYDGFLKKHALSANLQSFTSGLFVSLLALICLVTTVYLSIKNCPKKVKKKSAIKSENSL